MLDEGAELRSNSEVVYACDLVTVALLGDNCMSRLAIRIGNLTDASHDFKSNFKLYRASRSRASLLFESELIPFAGLIHISRVRL